EVQKEIQMLKTLLKYADAIKYTTKGRMLLKALNRIPKSEKIIIFTEFISTQNYLSDLLDKNGFEGSYIIYNGKMSPQAKEKAIKDWIINKRILISTDAGSEGKNLQAAQYLFNYDLPWNPMRVEQRIGRIDRLGQTEDVNIFNFVAKHRITSIDTIEERVLALLEDKLDLFHLVIGETGLILGSIKEGKYLERNILALLLSSADEFENFTENLKKSRLSFLEKMEQMETTWKYFALDSIQASMDINQWVRDVLQKEQQKIKWFFQRFIDFLGIKHFVADEEVYEISTPTCFADLIPRETMWFTFDPNKIYERDYVEFITYGNQIFNRAVHLMLQEDKRIAHKTIPRAITPFSDPFLVFNFRVRFESLDLVEDEWFALAIDPNSGTIHDADIVNWVAPEKPLKATTFSKEAIQRAGEKIDRILKGKIRSLAEKKLGRNENLFTEEMIILREYTQGWDDLFRLFEGRWQADYQRTENEIQELEQPESSLDSKNQDIETLEQHLDRLNRHYKNQRHKYLDGKNKLKEEVESIQENLEERIKLEIEVEFVSLLLITPSS
ncbi:MAG: helicase-related protein, partial [Candidatus Hodarchaeota archaeon]